MSERALQAGSHRQAIKKQGMSGCEEMALHIAEAIDWERVQQVAGRNPEMAAMYTVYAGNDELRQAFHAWCVSPVQALAVEAVVLAAIEVEAVCPSYLELPAVLASFTSASFTSDADFLAARPLGRVLYRQAMYEVIEAELDQQQVAAMVKQQGKQAVEQVLAAWAGDWYKQVYAPRRFEQQEVFEVIDSVIRLRDRRLAVSVSLSWRVGCAVGFLSALSVAQREEADKGMVILAGLVAPLLSRDRARETSGEKRRRVKSGRK